MEKKIYAWEPYFFMFFGLFHLHRIWGLIDRKSYADFWVGMMVRLYITGRVCFCIRCQTIDAKKTITWIWYCENCISFKLLSLEQYLQVYHASAKDGYRVNVREKKDYDKITFIENHLNNAWITIYLNLRRIYYDRISRC